MQTTITPYLDFAGRCEEALAFYEKALGAKVEMKMRFSESPDPLPPGSIQAGFEKKIMHSSFRIQGNLIMASDGMHDRTKFEGVELALTYPNEADVKKAFESLADGGTVVMPLGPTFWSPCFGMVKDRFGLGWLIMVPGPQEDCG